MGKVKIGSKDIRLADLMIGITASDRTPFMLSTISEAHPRGVKTTGIANNSGPPWEKL